MLPHAIARGAVGRVTQDAAAVVPLDDGVLVVIADGVSGSPGGREAACLVVAHATAFAEQARGPSLDASTFVDLLEHIDRSVHADGLAGESTAIVFTLGPDGLTGASVGDSRVLWATPGTCLDLSAEQPRKPRIGSGRARPTVFSRRGFSFPAGGGVIVAATDGLWESVSDAAVVAQALAGGSPAARAEALLALARGPRGHLLDDVTVIVIDVVEQEPSGARSNRVDHRASSG